MKLLYFGGEGQGMMMKGVTEYIVLVDPGEKPVTVVAAGHCCPGFELQASFDVVGPYPEGTLPTERVLKAEF